MPRIPSYPLIGSLSNNDLLVIDDVSQQYATKSVELQSLKGYFNTGQATTTYVDDKVVSGAGFNTNTGILTLTRTDGIDVTQDLDGRYALTSSVFSGNYNDLTNKPTIPTNNNQLTNGAGYTTNLGVVQTLTTNNSSGAATLTNGVLNIPQYSGGGGGSGVTSIIAGDGISIDPVTGTGNVTVTAGTAVASTWQTFYRKFTGNELKNAFAGSPSNEILLVNGAPNKVIVLGIEATFFLDFSTGTTDYADNTYSLAIYPDTASGFQFSTSINIGAIGSISSTNPFGIRFKNTTGSYTQSAPTGAAIVLGSYGTAVSITAGDRDFIITFPYRIIDLS